MWRGDRSREVKIRLNVSTVCRDQNSGRSREVAASRGLTVFQCTTAAVKSLLYNRTANFSESGTVIRVTYVPTFVFVFRWSALFGQRVKMYFVIGKKISL